ncbi:MAG: hypothetical protein HZA79_05895 [Sphingobacteriales bacterium]|nr:hypothetical protein [Sphingobacteriales bacterium]
MTDLDLIEEHYASIPDEKLILIAAKDSPDLTTEAFLLLKKEFSRRGLSIDKYLPVAETVSGEEPEPVSLFSNRPDNADKAMMGLTYTDFAIGAEVTAQSQNIQQQQEDWSITETATVLKKYETSFVINSLIFFIGLVVTIGSFETARAKGGHFILAWGAIFFGGINALRAWGKKREYRALMKYKQEQKDHTAGKE